MHKTLLSLVFGLAWSTAAMAASQSFYFHPSASPVTVPGGTTLRFLDTNAPATATVTADSVNAVHPGPAVAFTPFTAAAFATAGVLGPLIAAEVNLSTNIALTSCVDISVLLEKLDSTGTPSTLGTGTLLAQSVPQGASGGTVGFQDYHVPIPVAVDRTINVGESIRATVSVTNNCSASSSHPFHLAFDSTSAQTRIDAVALDPLPAKCLDSIDKAMATYVKTRLLYLGKCENGINEGTITPQDCHTGTVTAGKLAKASAKAVKSILKQCNDSFVIGPPPGGIGTAGCPGLTGQCNFTFTVLDDGVRGNANDYVDCMLCMAESASDQMVSIQYESTSPPTLDPTVADPCQVMIGKASTTFQNKKLKLLQKCRTLVNKGKFAGACPDPKTVTNIGKAAAKVASSIATKCTSGAVITGPRPTGLGVAACPGPPVACQNPILSVTDESTCMSCTHEFFDDCLFPATIGQSGAGCP